MHLADFLSPDQIVAGLASRTKAEVLDELAAPLVEKHDFLERSEVNSVLVSRENLGTTGIGDGVAIPHGKIAGLDNILISAGLSREGVDFAALDHKPVHIFFLVLAPEKSAGKHLKILAFISRLLQDPDFKDSFINAQTREELWNLINRV
ncbi:PTS sugar transporter subunit IIA [Desulfonatronospira sp. MSAO_Bac3]|uniref:PTS sugar transporter subunit IIA n=1 Tax=Desulfonatronospira sp. MSAO_Bac3 TaxID=2293857 RepID=UPI000FF655B3|nr:PTS sugar transporter subunit IIA [Desulfonatronospira sp. MSAO_Bac3]RQD73680.1 MAG: PTS sugar transporter subunit IIA [Desulfonatronospira sp. MSAO_Bac3]